MRLGRWLDDQWWWHRLCGHKVSRSVVRTNPELDYFYFWTRMCEDCDYTWLG